MEVPAGWVCLDGELCPAAEARVSIFDHGLLYGDGLFETFRVYSGKFFRMDAHLQRLEDGALRLELALPWDRALLQEALRATVRANGIRDGALRLTVTRGEGPPIPDPRVCSRTHFFITARTWTPPGTEAFERGWRVSTEGKFPGGCLSGLKTLSYLGFQQARQSARTLGYDEALLLDGKDLVEASTANLFLVKDGVLLTPDRLSGCLPGITRGAVLQLAAKMGIRTRERALNVRWLEVCDEAFLTNSLIELMPIVEYDHRALGDGEPGAITRRLLAGYHGLLAQELCD